MELALWGGVSSLPDAGRGCEEMSAGAGATARKAGPLPWFTKVYHLRGDDALCSRLPCKESWPHRRHDEAAITGG